MSRIHSFYCLTAHVLRFNIFSYYAMLELCHVSLFSGTPVRSDPPSPVFSQFEAFPRPVGSLEVVMPPRSERNVNVVFEPASCASYRGTVVIRPAGLQPERRDVAMVRPHCRVHTPRLFRSPRRYRTFANWSDQWLFSGRLVHKRRLSM